MENGEERRRRMSIDNHNQTQNPSSGGFILFAPNNDPIEEVAFIAKLSKELEDDLQKLTHDIWVHKMNVKNLKTLKIKFDKSISDTQVHLKQFDTNFAISGDTDNTHVDSVMDTVQNICMYTKSPAAFLVNITRVDPGWDSITDITHCPFMKDVIGIVATLGKVEDDNLSRMLSEYLGIETMLGVVCRTYETSKAVAAYNRRGFPPDIDYGDARFRAFCIESLRPYDGKLIAGDPQKRLDIPEPRLANMETPPGFLGFAVNMVVLDYYNLCWKTRAGHSLRETLFYNLFSTLQVYKSEEDMMNALPFITTGAVSLDGGIMRSPGLFVLGYHRQENVDVKFPLMPKVVPDGYLEIQKRMQEATWMKDRTLYELQAELGLLESAMLSFKITRASIDNLDR